MEKLRFIGLAAMLAAAVVVGCSELESPTDVVAAAGVAPGGGTDQGEACYKWSCSEYVCGGPTWPPYHACCVKSIYDPPDCSYENPCIPEEEPLCWPCSGCSMQDNQCEWHWPDFCDFIDNMPCADCCDAEAECRSDPITPSVCAARQEVMQNRPDSTCFLVSPECEAYCEGGIS